MLRKNIISLDECLSLLDQKEIEICNKDNIALIKFPDGRYDCSDDNQGQRICKKISSWEEIHYGQINDDEYIMICREKFGKEGLKVCNSDDNIQVEIEASGLSYKMLPNDDDAS